MPDFKAQAPFALDQLARDFAHRLRDLVEQATRVRGQELIGEIFAAVQAGPATRLARRELKQAARERQRLVKSLTRAFLHDIERVTRARVRKAVAREHALRARLAARTAAAEQPLVAKPVRRRARRRPLPPPPDPEQLKRDAEVARLRALLRPATEELPPQLPAPVASAPAAPPKRPATPGELLRALEKEIQDAVPSLAALGPERCGARIAAWAGQVRELRDRLAPEVLAVMRAAIRIFLEHLTELRAAMDAHFVDALEPKWSAPDWGVYIEVNRARAEGRAPALSAAQLEAHHRAMLRALVQHHRRSVPAQAIPVINAAAEFLPADDGQLRSAIRRHSSEWGANAKPTPGSPLASPALDPPASEEAGSVGPSADQPASDAAADGQASRDAAGPGAVAPPASPVEPPTPSTDQSLAVAPEPSPSPTNEAPIGEFDQPWTK